MTKYRVTCAKCAKTWLRSRAPLPVSWCSERCKEAWFADRPAEKRQETMIPMSVCASRILNRIVYPDHNVWSRKPAPEGDN